MIDPYRYDRLMRFVRARFSAADWAEAALALVGEDAEATARGLERLMRLTQWQDLSAKPWDRGMRSIGHVLPVPMPDCEFEEAAE